MNEKWFNLDIGEVEKKLKTNAASGLSRKAARSRANEGAGYLFYTPRKSPLKMFIELFGDIALLILVLGAAFSLFFEIEEYLRGLATLIVIIVNLTVCGIMYFRSQRMTESMLSLFYPTARVIRNGRLFYVDSRSLVKGDVILLQKGDILCADARLITSDGLKVRMQLDRERYAELDKFAGVIVDGRENRAVNMTNMVHGGSVVLKGSARAIVTAVGKYTYLGAMTGGIPLPTSDKEILLLTSLKKKFSKINMGLLIGVLPFTVISLLLGNLISDRASLLSVAFLTALSLAATTLSPMSCALFKLFYGKKLRELVGGNDPIVVRSIEELDSITSADYLFVLDGASLTDGMLHFDVASVAEGEIRNYSMLNKTSTRFFEYVALYYASATQGVSRGMSGASELMGGIKECIERSGVDCGALKIRCRIRSFFSGNMMNAPEQTLFADGVNEYRINVYKTKYALNNCRSVMIGGRAQTLTDDGRRNIERAIGSYVADGRSVILFTLSYEDEPALGECYIGALSFKDGTDDNVISRVSLIERTGCKPIFFRRDGDYQIPKSLLNTASVSKKDFVVRRLPVSYGFGKYSVYSDFSDADITDLITFAKTQGKRVVVLGFTENAMEIAQRADGFITNSRISTSFRGRLNEEIYVTETPGEEGSPSAPQTVKNCAGCMIERPKNGRGGMSALAKAFVGVRAVYKNASDYFRYLFAMQIIRLVVVGIPMLLGDASLDARHVLFSAFIIDMLAMFAFMDRLALRHRRGERSLLTDSVVDYAKYDLPLSVASLASSALAIVLPKILDLIIGRYDYKIEGLFTSLLILQIGVFFSVYYSKNIKELKSIYKNKFFIIAFTIIVLLLVLSFAIQPIGLLFGFEGFMPLPYFAICFVPLISYLAIFFIMEYKNINKS